MAPGAKAHIFVGLSGTAEAVPFPKRSWNAFQTICEMRYGFHVILRSTSGIPGQRVLSELRLENYAVIDSLAVEFAAGLNLLTGETGAGKSILIDALAFLLGEKASTDV